MAVLLLVGSLAAAEEPPTFDGRDVGAWADLFENPQEAWAARDRLGAGGKSAVPVASALLDHPSPKVRAWACMVVAALGADGVGLRDRVLERLHDADPEVREDAVGAVEEMVDTLGIRILEPVRTILREERGFTARGRAARALGQLGTAAIVAIPDLVECLEHGERYCADDCVTALLSMGPEGVAALARVWARLPPERRKDGGEGVPERAEAAGPALLRLAGADDADLSSSAADLVVAAGWRVLPAIDAAVKGASETSAVALTTLRGRVIAEAVRTLLSPGEDDLLERGAPLALDPGTLVLAWEGGSGHGNTLGLHRSIRGDAGMDVRTIAFSGPSLGNRSAKDRARVVRRGPLPAARLAAACELLSHVLSARLVERPREPGEGVSSSSDFHARLRVQSGGREVFSETFTGYRGSSSHRTSCRLEAARSVLGDLLDGVPSAEGPATEEDLSYLLTRCGGLPSDEWWVKTRVLRAVAGVGDARFEPLLRAYIESPPREYPWDHVAAIDAYAQITGVDLRTTPFERERVPIVRARYRKYFQEHPPVPGMD